MVMTAPVVICISNVEELRWAENYTATVGTRGAPAHSEARLKCCNTGAVHTRHSRLWRRL
mgnify:CR=1 FL=1